MAKLKEAAAREKAEEMLANLHEMTGIDELHEVFTDLDDHPELDENPDVNYIVGYVSGLADAFGWDLIKLARAVGGLGRRR